MFSDNFDSSDDDLEEFLENFEEPKSLNYFEDIIPKFTEKQYLEHFRVSRWLTEDLANRFKQSEYYHHQEGDSKKMSALKFITVFLWFAGNDASSFRDVADRFNITKSSLFKVVQRVTYFISNLAVEYIKWPTEEKKLETLNFFAEEGFPGVVGVIDGTHVKIDKPADDPDSYLNRQSFYSIQAQVVCDHEKRIIDIFVGYPGSVDDNMVFDNSPLCTTLEEKCGENYILGDNGYPCLKHLLTPFKDRGQLTKRQSNYNYALSKNRYIIEHAFGLLKQKFRQLHHLKLKNIPHIVHFIRACAVLHNLSLEEELLLEEHVDEGENEDVIQDEGDEDDRNGVLKRNEVMNNLHLEI